MSKRDQWGHPQRCFCLTVQLHSLLLAASIYKTAFTPFLVAEKRLIGGLELTCKARRAMMNDKHTVAI